MNTSHKHPSRGFISLGLILLLVIGLAVIGGGGWYVSQTRPAPMELPEPSATTTTITTAAPAPTETTRPGPQIYTNAEYGYSFQIPADYRVKRTDGSGHSDFILPQDGDGPSAHIEAEVDGGNCHFGLCEKFMLAREKIVLNGITWDYLGQTSYLGTQPLTESYRTKHGGKAFYAQSTSKELVESLLKTFKFTQ